jgi:hypothetical protein
MDLLVSNTSRVVAIGVASKAPKSPMPALLTRTSMGPLASSAAAILKGLGESSPHQFDPEGRSTTEACLGSRSVPTHRWSVAVDLYSERHLRKNEVHSYAKWVISV